MNSVFAKVRPFLRLSTLRLVTGMPHLLKTGQIGDGREDAILQRVLTTAEPGNVDDAIRIIDEFAHNDAILINIGDEKGLILDAAIKRANAQRLLELGAYIGYSALRTARVMPAGAHLYSVELSPANAAISRKVLEHAGVSDRVTIVDGKIGDPATMSQLRKVFAGGKLDFAFLDHWKDAYLRDLKTIIAEGWLHSGSIVVADNVKVPGAPDYLAYMRSDNGKTWRTTEHQTHVEYLGVIKDLVLESSYVG